jgi:hypothetical protein
MEVVLMVSGPEGRIVREKFVLVNVCCMGLESTTVTEKVDVPGRVGVPEITPVFCNTSPEGRLPL